MGYSLEQQTCSFESQCSDTFNKFKMSTIKPLCLFLILQTGLVVSELQGISTKGSKLALTDVSKDVHFYLWTRENPSLGDTLMYNDNLAEDLSSSHFDPNRRTKILVHGFMDNGLIQWIRDTRDALLEAGDFNVISVDWGSLSRDIIYPLVVEYCEPVGFLTADFISYVINAYQDDPITFDDFHVIGHSLGAHIAGYAGVHLNGVLSRITGLDPAQPEFFPTPNKDHLDKTDAQFVDIIHTCGPLIGLDSANGHVDFYP